MCLKTTGVYCLLLIRALKPSTVHFWHGQFQRLAALEARASKRATGAWQFYFPSVFFLYGLLLGMLSN